MLPDACLKITSVATIEIDCQLFIKGTNKGFLLIVPIRGARKRC